MTADKSLHQPIKQYLVVGRLIPTESNPSPPILRMRIFANNKVLAESRYWYILRNLRKIKKKKGEILYINKIKENKYNTYIKNYGIFIKYKSTTGIHNMYKEIRDLSANNAISQIYAEMAGRHRALPSNIQIIRIMQLNGKDCRRPHVQQMLKNKIKIPAIRRIMPIPKYKKSLFIASRPRLFLK